MLIFRGAGSLSDTTFKVSACSSHADWNTDLVTSGISYHLHVAMSRCPELASLGWEGKLSREPCSMLVESE